MPFLFYSEVLFRLLSFLPLLYIAEFIKKYLHKNKKQAGWRKYCYL